MFVTEERESVSSSVVETGPVDYDSGASSAPKNLSAGAKSNLLAHRLHELAAAGVTDEIRKREEAKVRRYPLLYPAEEGEAERVRDVGDCWRLLLGFSH
ncbi:MAG: uncharacterized protein KVP18_003570 [Porospora cf. gigantea A]|uniref:uncharacterized protein n=1 Tax=Porospora cf. gigantea A TaxID=2853593 RepID=UPI003559CB3D|nr:MAG: hypothetical protein KVP18_003570 [Porospora cf. gigantea A]